MKKLTKLLAVLLAVTMIVSLLPIVAYADEEPAEPAAETVETVEVPTEEKTEETPAVTLETAEKTEPIVSATIDATDDEDAVSKGAYWSYTSVGGVTTYYAALMGTNGAYTQGLKNDSDATRSVGGVLKVLQDYTIDDSVAKEHNSGIINAPAKAINLDFNGHTVTNVNTNANYGSLMRIGNDANDYNVHIYSSAEDGLGNTIRGNYVFTTLSGSTVRCLIASLGGTASTGSENVTIEDMNVTTRHQPALLLADKNVNLTVRNCSMAMTVTSASYTPVLVCPSAAITKDNEETATASVTIENSDLYSLEAGGMRIMDAYFYNGTTREGAFSYTLTLNGTNTFGCKNNAAGHSGAALANHGIVLDMQAAGGHTYVNPVSVATCDSGKNLAFTDADDGTNFICTVAESDAALCTVIFDLGDNPAAIDPQNVTAGTSPSAVSVPSYESGGVFYSFAYWTIEGDETHYTNLNDITVEDDLTLFANYDIITPAATCTIGDETAIYETLTDAWKAADGKTATIDLCQDVVFDYDTAEKGTTSATNHTWFDANNGTNITLNLHGHTIDGGTDDTAYGTDGNKYFDRGIVRFNHATNGSYGLTINGDGGEIITRGIRSIFVFGSTSSSTSLNALDLTINDTTLRVTNDCNAGDTSRSNTTNFIQVNQKSDVQSIAITLNNCDLRCEYDDTMKTAKMNYVFCNYNFSNTGACPIHYEANNCTFRQINYLTNRLTSFTASSTTYNAVAEQQVTFDAATAYAVMTDEMMQGKVNTRVRIDAASYDPEIETYVLNPQEMLAGVSTDVFKLESISMSLNDYVYVNVKPNETWTSDYQVTTSLTNEAVTLKGAGQISNLAIPAKDMGTSFVITAFADPNATTRYLSGTSGSIDTFAGLTKDAASGTAAEELVAAMDAMMLYGDWAAYNFGAASTAPAAVEPYDTSGIIGEMAVEGKASPYSGKAGYYGASAVLDGQLYLKHYFYLVPALDETNAVVTDAASAVVDDVIRGDDGSGKFGFVKIKLAPKNFLEMYTVAVTNDAETYTVTGSFADYAAALTGVGATETEQTLAHALLQYCAAAKVYFDAVSA